MPEKLDIRVIRATNQVSQMKRGHETSGQILGVSSHVNPTHFEHLNNSLEQRTLSDGTTLIRENLVTRALISELAIGSIVGISEVDAKINDIPEGFIDAYEMIGIKIADTQSGSLFWTLVRVGDQKGKQGKWRSYQIDAEVRTEKQDSIETLQALLSPNQGIEASQIFSALLSLEPDAQQIYAGRNISGAGCFSHDKPKEAIPANILLGNARPLPRPIIISGENQNRFVRIRKQDLSISPLAHPSQESYDSQKLLRVALVNKSIQLAGENITNLGAGTSPETVLEAIYETTEVLPELVGNEATIKQSQQIFRQNLGIR